MWAERWSKKKKREEPFETVTLWGKAVSDSAILAGETMSRASPPTIPGFHYYIYAVFMRLDGGISIHIEEEVDYCNYHSPAYQ